MPRARGIARQKARLTRVHGRLTVACARSSQLLVVCTSCKTVACSPVGPTPWFREAGCGYHGRFGWRVSHTPRCRQHATHHIWQDGVGQGVHHHNGGRQGQLRLTLSCWRCCVVCTILTRPPPWVGLCRGRIHVPCLDAARSLACAVRAGAGRRLAAPGLAEARHTRTYGVGWWAGVCMRNVSRWAMVLLAGEPRTRVANVCAGWVVVSPLRPGECLDSRWRMTET